MKVIVWSDAHWTQDVENCKTLEEASKFIKDFTIQHKLTLAKFKIEGECVVEEAITLGALFG